MNKTRLEAFSDGVLAIIITVMVLEMKTPHGETLDSLIPIWPVFLSYLLSFIYVGIYWSNHHHLLQVVKKVSGKTLWANTHLLFWLSLLPFVTSWSGESHFAPTPVACYGFVLFMCAIAYFILTKVLMTVGHSNDDLAMIFGRDLKGKVSAALCGIAIPLAYVHPAVALALYAIVALTWLVPDTRVENHLLKNQNEPHA